MAQEALNALSHTYHEGSVARILSSAARATCGEVRSGPCFLRRVRPWWACVHPLAHEGDRYEMLDQADPNVYPRIATLVQNRFWETRRVWL